MGIVDQDNFLSKEEREIYNKLLDRYGFKPTDFVLEITEDQEAVDMNDMVYIVLIKVRATSLKNHKSKTYEDRIDAKTWLDEFEADLLTDYFTT